MVGWYAIQTVVLNCTQFHFSIRSQLHFTNYPAPNNIKIMQIYGGEFEEDSRPCMVSHCATDFETGRVMDAVSIDKRTTHHIKKAKHKLNNVDLPRTSARCMNACENHVCEL
jgi:hypothetical protein